MQPAAPICAKQTKRPERKKERKKKINRTHPTRTQLVILFIVLVFLILIIFSARNGTAAQLGEVDAAEVVSAA